MSVLTLDSNSLLLLLQSAISKFSFSLYINSEANKLSSSLSSSLFPAHSITHLSISNFWRVIYLITESIFKKLAKIIFLLFLAISIALVQLVVEIAIDLLLTNSELKEIG